MEDGETVCEPNESEQCGLGDLRRTWLLSAHLYQKVFSH